MKDNETCESMTEQQQLEKDARMGKVLYSIRAKFYDRYNVRQDCDNNIEELIFDKFDELEKGESK